MNVLDELVFMTGFETGATYTNTVLPALRQRSERILAAGARRVAAAAVAVDTLTIECFAKRPCDVIVEQAAAVAGRSHRHRHARPARRRTA